MGGSVFLGAGPSAASGEAGESWVSGEEGDGCCWVSGGGGAGVGLSSEEEEKEEASFSSWAWAGMMKSVMRSARVMKIVRRDIRCGDLLVVALFIVLL